ncbi:MAG: DUF4255 domain-containing protein [Roseivirga sp.]|nr:DUF4255 domain-containing protein [Roseivirga sp.]
MIKEALKYIAQDLDTYLRRKYDSPESRVHLGNILDLDGSVPEENRNKIVLTLINIEPETNISTTQSGFTAGQTFQRTNPPLRFNLDLLFSGLFNQYEESLKFVADTIYFFQSKSLFNAQNSPGLSPEIQQLTLEVLKYNLHEMHSLWTSLGAKYQPSVILKTRMLTFQTDQVVEEVATMQNPGLEARPKS